MACWNDLPPEMKRKIFSYFKYKPDLLYPSEIVTKYVKSFSHRTAPFAEISNLVMHFTWEDDGRLVVDLFDSCPGVFKFYIRFRRSVHEAIENIFRVRFQEFGVCKKLKSVGKFTRERPFLYLNVENSKLIFVGGYDAQSDEKTKILHFNAQQLILL
jgi:hypothetical protein